MFYEYIYTCITCEMKRRNIYINKNYSSRVLKEKFIFFQKYLYFYKIYKAKNITI